MIRFAEKKDLERVNELRRQVSQVHANGRPDIFRAEFRSEMRDLIYSIWESENKDIIVAVQDNIICGFACVQYITKPESPYSLERKYYQVAEFGVDENYRRQGIGRELFQYIRADAKKKGFNRIELDMWEFNEGALKFYEAVGFRTYRRYMECNKL